MTVRLRFAPSPTGRLHIGNARAALINWLYAKAKGGQFMLRIDDTDLERSTKENEEFIKTDLEWLGLKWDLFDRQSDRMKRYADAFETLKAKGRLYPCYETQEELDLKRKIQLSRGKPPIYDRAALKMTDAEKAKFEAEGRKPHWRFKLDHAPIVWGDLIRGENKFHGENLSDPVLYREGLAPVYMLASVVDDGDFEISHIVRGEDHVPNTAIQIQLFEALGCKVPTFAHFSLITDVSGEGFSKRLGSLSLGTLRESGVEPMAINSLLAHLGTSQPIEPKLTLAELAQGFDVTIFSRNPAKFDKKELEALNTKILHIEPFAVVKEKLAKRGMTQVTEEFWNIVRGNIEKIEDVKQWWDVCHAQLQPVIEDADFAKQAAALLPPEPWDQTTWNKLVDAVKTATGRKGKALFMPLRLALTGKEHGPELTGLLPFIGKTKAQKRLLGEAA